MTSKIKVDNINKVSDDSNIINKCGTAINVGASGNTVTVTGNDIRSDSYKAADGGVIISQSGTAVTIGASGDTVSLASGASQSGFGRSGSVNWVTTPKTSTFTGVSGNGYFINSGSALTCNLPAGVAGDIISFSDYARNFNTYNFSVSPNGSEKIGGTDADATLDVNGQAATFVYVDSTKGWVNVQNAEDTETGVVRFICASGGTETEDGDFKMHTFTGPGTFTVNGISACTPARNIVSYLVVAGGGSGGVCGGGGGGAGGFREGKNAPICTYTVSPLSAPAGIPVTVQGYPIVVGAGGAQQNPPGGTNQNGNSGSVSTFGPISSAGGGGGGSFENGPSTPACRAALTGGSGGGSGGLASPVANAGAAGNTPPTSPAQGKNGGSGQHIGGDSMAGGAGGGATAVGGNGTGQTPGPGKGAGGVGGTGATTHISGSPLAYAGGGGGSGYGGCGTAAASPCGTGGKGGKNNSTASDAGTTNRGGGGGGGAHTGGGPNGGAGGGSGVVVIRYKFQ